MGGSGTHVKSDKQLSQKRIPPKPLLSFLESELNFFLVGGWVAEYSEKHGVITVFLSQRAWDSFFSFEFLILVAREKEEEKEVENQQGVTLGVA